MAALDVDGPAADRVRGEIEALAAKHPRFRFHATLSRPSPAWSSSSPPPRHNFVTIPRIRSESPAFDLHHPEIAAIEMYENPAEDSPAVGDLPDTDGRAGHLNNMLDKDGEDR